MADLMNTQPGFLEQVVGIGAAGELREEKTMQLRTDAMDESGSGGEIAGLITGHQAFQFAVRMHKRASRRTILIQLGVWLQTNLRLWFQTIGLSPSR